MRAWMYQLNPDKGRFYDDEWEEVPTTTENLFRYELASSSGIAGPWYVKQFFYDAEPGDPLIIKVGGKEKAGVVACGHVHRLEPVGDEWLLWFRVDLAASMALRADPIPFSWIQATVAKSQRNLVDIAPAWKKIATQLHKRGALPAEVELVETDEPLDEEGRRALRVHTALERSPTNRRRVLDAAQKPYRCEACEFSFGEAFGADFADYIQVHHVRPVSRGPYTPVPDDFALLCANCHAIAHWRRAATPLSVEELRSLRTGPSEPPQPPSAGLFTVDADVRGPAAIWIFDPGEDESAVRDAIRSVVISLGAVVTDGTSERLRLFSGDVTPRSELGHLVLEDFYRPERFAIVLEGPWEVQRRVLHTWSQNAPRRAVSAGTIAVGGADLGLVLRVVVEPDGRSFMGRGDAGQGIDTLLAAAVGKPVVRIEDMALEWLAQGAIGAAEAVSV